MHIKSLIYKSNQELELDFIPTLVFLFFESEREDLVINVYHKLKSINKKIKIVGINGHKGNINSNIPYITKKQQISVVAFDIDYKYFNIEIFNSDDNFEESFFKSLKDYKKSSSIIFPSFRYDINKFLNSARKEMNNIYGGIYGVNNNIGCFYKGDFYSDKIVTVTFDSEVIEFFSMAIHGFKPIGLHFKITKSFKDKIIELNNSPALEVLEQYMGKIKQENIDNFLHPFCVYHDGYESLASIHSIDRKNKTINCYKYIYEGESIRITIPSNQNSIVNYLDDVLKNIECDGLFMFSCIGRYAYYKELIEFEIAKVSEVLKKPFGGFLTYGEIGSNDIHTKSILQNQTMNLVFFKVKK